MILVAMDTATPSTVAGVLLDGGRVVEARDDPPEGSRGEHASRLLVLVERALGEAGVGWPDVERIAVGVGPGGFTGLRIGIATARALAQARGLPLVPVSSLAALAAGTGAAGGAVAAVVDARRGEVFAAGWRDGVQVAGPVAIAPSQIAEIAGEGWLAVGDGALRFRSDLEGAGCAVPEDGSPQHGVSALAVCRLARQARQPAERDLVVPDYLRKPDAVRSKP